MVEERTVAEERMVAEGQGPSPRSPSAHDSCHPTLPPPPTLSSPPTLPLSPPTPHPPPLPILPRLGREKPFPFHLLCLFSCPSETARRGPRSTARDPRSTRALPPPAAPWQLHAAPLPRSPTRSPSAPPPHLPPHLRHASAPPPPSPLLRAPPPALSRPPSLRGALATSQRPRRSAQPIGTRALRPAGRPRSRSLRAIRARTSS